VGGAGTIARAENSRLERDTRPYKRDDNSKDWKVVSVVVVKRLIDGPIGEVGGKITMGDGRGRNADIPGCRTGLRSANARAALRSVKKHEGSEKSRKESKKCASDHECWPPMPHFMFLYYDTVPIALQEAAATRKTLSVSR
jgi:hypothetical protein